MDTGPKRHEPASDVLTLGDSGHSLMVKAAIVGAIALAAAFFLAALSGNWIRQFSVAYLISFCFYATLSLGGLFFVLILHLTRAGWGISVRRIAEILAMNIIPLLVLFLPIMIPVLLNAKTLYVWNGVVEDELILHKKAYLNGGFFTIRNLLYFVIWGGMAAFFFRNSLAQDESGDTKLTLRMQSLSAPLMILFAATITFASFDWEMSLQPEWFSTIFPVYIFAGAVLSCLSTLIIIAVLLQRSGRLTEDITIDNYHDLSKLTFGFVVFWGYIAFSQYLLIWYANIPEETFWYKLRQENGWAAVSLVLLFGHLLIPMLAIMARSVRRNKAYMFGAAIYLLAMHYLDHFWLVMPAFTSMEEGGLTLGFTNLLCCLLCFVGLGGLFVASFCYLAGSKALIPMKDPRLVESLNYTNW